MSASESLRSLSPRASRDSEESGEDAADDEAEEEASAPRLSVCMLTRKISTASASLLTAERTRL